MINLRLAEKKYEKIKISMSYDETLGALMPFKVADIIIIYYAYWLLIKNVGIIFEYNEDIMQHIFYFKKFFDNFFIKYEERI